jgi:transposase
MEMRDARSLSPKELEDRRKQAIKLREGGMKYSDITEIVGVNRNTVSDWYKLWQAGGAKALKVKSPGKPKGSGCSLNEEQQKKVKSCLIHCTPDQLQFDFALWTRSAVQALIEDLFKIVMPIRTVGDYLKRWGFTPQKPVKRAYERCDKKVKKWLDEEYPAIEKRAFEEDAEIHWGDETGMKNQDQVGRGYAPRGKTPVRIHKGKRESINMISTVTKQGKIRFMFYEGSMNYQRLIKFMSRLIKDTKKKVFLILDNLRVHHAKKVKEWILKRADKIDIFYLPSYSPDLNPDEYLNRDLKGQLSKRPSKRKEGGFKAQAKTEMRRLQKSPSRAAKYFHSEKIKYAA